MTKESGFTEAQQAKSIVSLANYEIETAGSSSDQKLNRSKLEYAKVLIDFKLIPLLSNIDSQQLSKLAIASVYEKLVYMSKKKRKHHKSKTKTTIKHTYSPPLHL